MSTKKPLEDYIAQCMDESGVEAPVDQFMEAFCSRCLNPGCRRSTLNELKWTQRMHRQLEALHNPQFADPNDPDYQHLASQNFISFEKEKVTLDSWDHFEGPKKEPVIHRADPPTKQHGGEKVDQSVNQLAASRGKEVAQPVAEEEPTPEEPTPEEPTPEPKPQKKILAPTGKSRYNTEIPTEGILLSPEEGKKVSTPAPLTKKDPWALPSKGKETLVVRAGDGKVVDKKVSSKKSDDTD